jgi:hypothetical protein
MMAMVVLSDAEVAELVRMWNEGVPVRVIYNRMGYCDAVIRRERARLGLTARAANNSRWTPAEDAILKSIVWPCSRRRACELLPGRTWNGIAGRARAFGIRPLSARMGDNSLYTADEDAVIRANYGRSPIADWAHLLPTRSDKGICARAGLLGLVSDLSSAHRAMRIRAARQAVAA